VKDIIGCSEVLLLGNLTTSLPPFSYSYDERERSGGWELSPVDQRRFRMKACWIGMSPELQIDLFFASFRAREKGLGSEVNICNLYTSFLHGGSIATVCRGKFPTLTQSLHTIV
jgi:hypothetical protein